MLLLLVQLIDDLILFSNFIIKTLDGVVSGCFLLLNLADSKLNIFNILLNNTNRTSMLLDFSSKLNSGCLLRSKSLLSLGKFHLSFSLDSGSHSTNFSLKSSSDIKSLLVLAISVLGLLLQESKLFLGVGHSNGRTSLLDDDKPSPVSHSHELSELPLANLDKFSLISTLSIMSKLNALVALTWQVSDKLVDNFISSLFKLSQSTSSEEDKSVSKTVSFSVKFNLVHEGIDSSLVVRGASNFSSTKDGISHLVVRVQHSVGESSHTDSDTLKHTITSELMHNERRLNLSRLLVSVGHQATHKVGLTSVQSGHELTKGNQV